MGTYTVRFQDINTFDGIAFTALINGHKEKYETLVDGIAKMRGCEFSEVDGTIRGHLVTLRELVAPIFAQRQTAKIVAGDSKLSEEQIQALDALLAPYSHKFYEYCAGELALYKHDSDMALGALLHLQAHQQ